jgi:hypothetical protein
MNRQVLIQPSVPLSCFRRWVVFCTAGLDIYLENRAEFQIFRPFSVMITNTEMFFSADVDYQLPSGLLPDQTALMNDDDGIPDVDLVNAAISVEMEESIIAEHSFSSIDSASDEELVHAAVLAETDVIAD